MSWMDSWSRPSKHAVTPPPLYLTVGDSVPYCHSCGRVISERRKTQKATAVKYCSARCRNTKPGPMDRKIEATFAALLDGASPESLNDIVGDDIIKEGAKATENKEKEKDKDPFGSKGERKHKKKASKSTKGETRIILDCSTVELLFFQREKDPEKVYGRRKNRKARFVVEKPEDWRSVDMVDQPASAERASLLPVTEPSSPSEEEEEGSDYSDEHELDHNDDDDDDDDDDDEGGIALETPSRLSPTISYGYGSGKVRPPQPQNDLNGSIGGEKGRAERAPETEAMKQKRREGQQRAEEREAVRRAARRGCAFGFARAGPGGEGERRKCEAVMKGSVVEASFAKGEWGVRWREGLA